MHSGWCKVAKKEVAKKKKNAGYYFRGTSLGYKGNQSSLFIPATCFSTNPAIAFAFAKCCSLLGKGVIYIATHQNTTDQPRIAGNSLEKFEKEIAFALKPLEFYKHCEGYITVAQAAGILIELGVKHDWPASFRELTGMELERIPQMTPAQIEGFYERAKPLLENN